VYTDHKPLIFALSSTAERFLRQARQLSFITEFTTDIQYIQGKHNVVADALSRINAVTSFAIDFQYCSWLPIKQFLQKFVRTVLLSLILF